MSNNRVTNNGGGDMNNFGTMNVVLFDSRNPKSAQNMGGYIYPTLDYALRANRGTWYRITSHDIRKSDLDMLKLAIVSKGVVWGTVKDDKLILVEADFKIGDLGFELKNRIGQPLKRGSITEQVELVKDSSFIYGVLELRLRALHTWGPLYTPQEQYSSEDLVDLASQMSDPNGSKMLKRAGFVTRPFRLTTSRSHFNVRVIPGGTTRDGIFFVSNRIRREMVAKIILPGYASATEKVFKDYILSNHSVDNGLVFGRMLDQDGNPIEGMIKGQIWYIDLPKGVDIVAPEDCIKHEMQYNENLNVAIIGGDPQGLKPLRLDGQTSTNNGQVWDADRARKSLKLAGDKFLARLEDGRVMDLPQISDELIASKFSYDERTFTKMLKFRVRSWQAYGMDYRMSPWMTEQVGKTFVQSLHPDTPNNTRIPVNHGIRAQLMTADMINVRFNLMEEALQDDSPDSKFSVAFNVDPGFIRLYKEQGVTFMVVEDEQYEELVLPNHGFGDLDDFYAFYFGFVMLKPFAGVTIPVLVCISTRNPNTRGEWTAWLVDPEDIPLLKDVNGDEVIPAVFSKKRWPMQLTQAQETGKVTMLELPSATDPSATAEDDRVVAAAYTQKLGQMIIEGSAKGKSIDRALVNRLGFPKDSGIAESLKTDENGPISTIFRIVNEYTDDYEKKLEKFIVGLEVPSFLSNPAIGVVGRPKLMAYCVSLLGRARFAMVETRENMKPMHRELISSLVGVLSEKELEDLEKELDRARFLAGIEAAEGKLLPWIEGGQGMERAHRVLALWLTSLTIPRSRAERDRVTREHAAGNIHVKARVSDQLIFGTGVFDHLLEALVYFGVAHVPYLTHEGEAKRATHIVFNDEDSSWNLTCKVCGREGVKRDRNSVATFWRNNLICGNDHS